MNVALIAAGFLAATSAPTTSTTIDFTALWPWMIEIISWAAIVGGSFFVLVGSIGLIRMPDVFTRMHAASVIDTMGAGLLIVGMMLQSGSIFVTLKLLFIFVLFFVTSPVATHALAQAALHAGDRPQLKHDRTGNAGGADDVKPGSNQAGGD